MDPGPLLALAALLFVKEAGLPVPVPGDLLVLGAGVAAALRPVEAPLILAVILAAGYAGGAVQFLLVRGALRDRIVGLLTRVGIGADRLDRLAERFRRGGARAVAVARATPGVRVAAIAASGLAALPFPTFGRGLVAGNALFVSGHFALGFVVGAPAEAAARTFGGAAAVGAVALVVLALVGVVGWRFLRRRRAGAAPAPVDIGLGGTFGAWADAACPACLSLAAFQAMSER